MKRLLSLVFFLVISIGLFSQTIYDKEKSVEFHQAGNTVTIISKSSVSKIIDDGQYVYLYTFSEAFPGKLVELIKVNHTDYGWSTIVLFRNYLSAIINNSYKIEYHYTTGLVDTISHYATDSLAYRIVYTYSGSDVTEKSVPINE